MNRFTQNNGSFVRKIRNEFARYVAFVPQENFNFVQKVLETNPSVFIDSRELTTLFSDNQPINKFTDLCGNIYENFEVSLRPTLSHTEGANETAAIKFGEGGLTYLATHNTNAVFTSGFEAVFVRNIKSATKLARPVQYVSGNNLLGGTGDGGLFAVAPALNKTFGSYLVAGDKLSAENKPSADASTSFKAYYHCSDGKLYENATEVASYSYSDAIPQTALAIIGARSGNPLQNLHFEGLQSVVIGYKRILTNEERIYIQSLIVKSKLI